MMDDDILKKTLFSCWTGFHAQLNVKWKKIHKKFQSEKKIRNPFDTLICDFSYFSRFVKFYVCISLSAEWKNLINWILSCLFCRMFEQSNDFCVLIITNRTQAKVLDKNKYYFSSFIHHLNGNCRDFKV